MPDELAGRTILVTGGTGDLGSATAGLLAAHGATRRRGRSAPAIEHYRAAAARR